LLFLPLERLYSHYFLLNFYSPFKTQLYDHFLNEDSLVHPAGQTYHFLFSTSTTCDTRPSGPAKGQGSGKASWKKHSSLSPEEGQAKRSGKGIPDRRNQVCQGQKACWDFGVKVLSRSLL
jgi:hypothetical protein